MLFALIFPPCSGWFYFQRVPLNKTHGPGWDIFAQESQAPKGAALPPDKILISPLQYGDLLILEGVIKYIRELFYHPPARGRVPILQPL